MQLAEEFGIPLLRTPQPTTEFAAQLTWFLALELAPREVLHAGLVDVAGEGVLILGRSGIGKSETALELVRRGHRLVADDTVEVRRPSDRDLVGRAPGRMRHFMEVKGIGIVNLRLDVRDRLGQGHQRDQHGGVAGAAGSRARLTHSSPTGWRSWASSCPW